MRGQIALSLEHVILGLLSEHPRSGYDLKTRCFSGPISPFWSADQAQIYRTLDRLQASKRASVTRRRQSGKPDRLLHDITPSGRDALEEWLASPAPLPATRDAFLLQLYFGASLPDDALTALLEARRVQHQARLDDLRAAVSRLTSGDSVHDRATTLRQTAFEGAMTRERAAIDWLDDCIDAVRDGALPGSEDEGIGQRHLFGT